MHCKRSLVDEKNNYYSYNCWKREIMFINLARSENCLSILENILFHTFSIFFFFFLASDEV